MELVANVYVSEFTKKTLEQFGWQEGHAIPADLGQIMIDMKEKLPPSSRTDVLIDKALMTEEQVKNVVELLQKARELGDRRKREAEIDAATQNMTPTVAEAYKKLNMPAEDSGPQIIDDRQAPSVNTSADKTEKQVSTDAAAQDQNKEQDKEKEKETAETGGVAAADATQTVVYCPRCGWDLRQKFEIVPSDADKEDFLATLLGNSRFKKQYDLFGGKIKVMFRSLLAEENKLIYRQLVLDQQNNKVATEAEWFTQMMDYRLACSLETIIDKSGKAVAVVPTLDEMKFTPDKEQPLMTALPQQLELINHTLAQEATRRIVGLHLRQFQRLVESLEAMALEPSFWNGIE